MPLKSGLKVTQGLKTVPLESFDTVSQSHSIETMAVPLAVSTRYTNETDGYPAKQTLHNGIGRTMHNIARQK